MRAVDLILQHLTVIILIPRLPSRSLPVAIFSWTSSISFCICFVPRSQPVFGGDRQGHLKTKDVIPCCTLLFATRI